MRSKIKMIVYILTICFGIMFSNRVYATEMVAIDEQFFPDENFRERVSLDKIDVNQDGYLSIEEREDVTELGFEDVVDATGLELFPNLRKVSFVRGLKKVDFSKNTKIIGASKIADEIAERYGVVVATNTITKWLCETAYVGVFHMNKKDSVLGVGHGQKTKSDINIVVEIQITRYNKQQNLLSVENVQIKLVSGARGFNQVEKKKVEGYVDMWHIDDKTKELLMLYDGELPPRPGSRHPKRMFINEFTQEEQEHFFFEIKII